MNYDEVKIISHFMYLVAIVYMIIIFKSLINKINYKYKINDIFNFEINTIYQFAVYFLYFEKKFLL